MNSPARNAEDLIARTKAFARWVFLFLLIPTLTGTAHDLFRDYVQHRVRVTLSSNHVDLTVALTLFEVEAARERARMDVDRDGRIQRTELSAYGAGLAARLTNQVRLLVEGRVVELSPLHEPEIDLLGDELPGEAHVRVNLFFFATKPAKLIAGTEFVIEDRLWPASPALLNLDAEGLDGAVLEAVRPPDPISRALREGQTRTLRARLVKPLPTAPLKASGPLH